MAEKFENLTDRICKEKNTMFYVVVDEGNILHGCLRKQCPKFKCIHILAISISIFIRWALFSLKINPVEYIHKINTLYC